MGFSEKLLELRRRDGLSQEQLAEQLEVTEQTVSRWESGAATPELNQLIAVSELFDVSVDYLVKEGVLPSETMVSETEDAGLEQKVKELEGMYQESFGSYYSYTSKRKLFGLPLVSVRFGRERHPTKRTTAVGIIAIGNFSVGVVSIGLISAGILSIGMIAFGLLALGMVAVGGWALGLSTIGIISVGAASLGIYG